MKNVVNRALAAKKKALFFLFCVALLCACKGPKGDPGEGMNWKIVDLEVSQWDYSADAFGYKDNNFYFAKFDVPALTSYVFTDGNVNGYIHMVEGDGQKSQHSLPYVLHIATKDNEGNPYYYTETVDFVYGVGWVQIEVRDSDFAYEDNEKIVPGTMKFRIVMTY